MNTKQMLQKEIKQRSSRLRELKEKEILLSTEIRELELIVESLEVVINAIYSDE